MRPAYGPARWKVVSSGAPMASPADRATTRVSNFIREIVSEDVAKGAFGGQVVTRFPPEPNGYLHLGHAYAARVSYEVAREFGGRFHLRFDDTNPLTEEQRYVESQIAALEWMGIDWGDNLFFASDYFPKLHAYAVQLIEQGQAYVCQLNQDVMRQQRGTATTPGIPSPYRDRSPEENLELFERMKNGDIAPGEAVLRAKIDMAAANLVMRDPVMYRILHVPHYRQGNDWCIYPIYDWAHCLEDSIEGVTHSLCSLEFENNRALYDWYLDQLGVHHPRQIEFSRLNVSHMVTSKRRLIQLVQEKRVDGWDDPRMPTVLGFRRRGVPAEAMCDFLSLISVSKAPTAVDISLLEYCVRQRLNSTANRVMAVLRPLKVIIDNYPEGQVEWFEADNNPESPEQGVRKVAFSRELYIEEEDFRIDPPPKYFRLSPGVEIRLKHAYLVTCESYVLDEATGRVLEVHCRYDPESRGGAAPDGRKVKGTSHWVSAAHCVDATVRLYDRLFAVEDPEDGDFIENLNSESRVDLGGCKLESYLAEVGTEVVQFLRQGYFAADRVDSKPGELVFNQVVSLKDSWAKIERRAR